MSSVKYVFMPCLQVITWQETRELKDFGMDMFSIVCSVTKRCTPSKKEGKIVHHQRQALCWKIWRLISIWWPLFWGVFIALTLKGGGKAVVKIGLRLIAFSRSPLNYFKCWSEVRRPATKMVRGEQISLQWRRSPIIVYSITPLPTHHTTICVTLRLRADVLQVLS